MWVLQVKYEAADDTVGTHVREFREKPLSEAEMESLKKSGYSER